MDSASPSPSPDFFCCPPAGPAMAIGCVCGSVITCSGVVAAAVDGSAIGTVGHVSGSAPIPSPPVTRLPVGTA